jgi:hypothetical protein
VGLPARKLETTARGAGRDGSRLRLVTAQRRPPQAATGPAEAACRSVFQLALVALVALTCLGLARVGLSARATEASMDQLKLERSIKAETRVADRLELDRSLLVTPSRIESIAAGMQMTQAAVVKYLAVPATATVPVAAPAPHDPGHAAAPTRDSASAGTLSAMFGAALDVTEKEARTLLVGDVGVAASR